MKKCPVCKMKKPFSEFHKCKRNKDGLQYYCKDCDHVFFCSTYYNNHMNGVKHNNVVMCNTLQNELNEKINRLGLV